MVKKILALVLVLTMALSMAAFAEANEWAIANKINDGSETAAELYELAKAEGSVVLYSISSRCTKVADSFNAQYPGVVELD